MVCINLNNKVQGYKLFTTTKINDERLFFALHSWKHNCNRNRKILSMKSACQLLMSLNDQLNADVWAVQCTYWWLCGPLCRFRMCIRRLRGMRLNHAVCNHFWVRCWRQTINGKHHRHSALVNWKHGVFVPSTSSSTSHSFFLFLLFLLLFLFFLLFSWFFLLFFFFFFFLLLYSFFPVFLFLFSSFFFFLLYFLSDFFGL